MGLGLISLTVTIWGFALSLYQIRKIKTSSEAAATAVVSTRKIVNSRDHSNKLTFAVQQLNVAKIYLATNASAAGAYVSTCHRSLIEAQHLADGRAEYELTSQIYKIRKILDDLQGQSDIGNQPLKLKKTAITLQDIADEVDVMAVRLRQYIEPTQEK